MISDSNNNDKKPNLNKVEEPTVDYKAEIIYPDITEHPLFAKVIEKSKKDALEGKGYTTEEVMKRVREKYPFLK